MVTADDLNELMRTAWPNSSIRCDAVTPTSATAVATVSDSHLRPGAFIAGPMLFTIADTAFWFLCSGVLGRVEPMAVTAELSMRFLRPGVGETLYARADLDRASRRSVVATIRLWTDGLVDRPCSVAQGTYALPTERSM